MIVACIRHLAHSKIDFLQILLRTRSFRQPQRSDALDQHWPITSSHLSTLLEHATLFADSHATCCRSRLWQFSQAANLRSGVLIFFSRRGKKGTPDRRLSAWLFAGYQRGRRPKGRERAKTNAWNARRSDLGGSRTFSLPRSFWPSSLSTACHASYSHVVERAKGTVLFSFHAFPSYFLFLSANSPSGLISISRLHFLITKSTGNILLWFQLQGWHSLKLFQVFHDRS